MARLITWLRRALPYGTADKAFDHIGQLTAYMRGLRPYGVVPSLLGEENEARSSMRPSNRHVADEIGRRMTALVQL